jgi:hypothetical protein
MRFLAGKSLKGQKGRSAITPWKNIPLHNLNGINMVVSWKMKASKRIFSELYTDANGNQDYRISPLFNFRKIRADVSFWYPCGNYDVIYFDAFGPDVQPELWTAEIFTGIARIMNPGAVLATYSAKGQVKRNLESAGLTVTRIAGPPGKREMIVARKPVAGIIPN